MNERYEAVLSDALRFLPVTWTSGLGALIGERTVLQDLRSGATWVNRLYDNVERLGVARTDDEKRAALVAYGRQVGRVYAEYTVLQKIARSDRVELVGQQHLRDRNTPTLYTLPHIANWEFCLLPLSRLPNPTCALYEPRESDARMRIANRARLAWGEQVSVLSSREPMAMRKIERMLREGFNLCILADEESGGRVQAPALGRSIPYSGNRWLLSRLAVKHGLDVIPLHLERTGPVRFRLHIEAPISPTAGAERRAEARRIADELDGLFDCWVRQRPEHWYWLSELDLSVTETPA